MSSCANCGQSIVWLETLCHWIHLESGHGACPAHRAVANGATLSFLAAIFGRRKVAFPSRRPTPPPLLPSSYQTRREVKSMLFDEIFEFGVVLDVPSAAAEYGRKMPGHQDSNGDHCQD